MVNRTHYELLEVVPTAQPVEIKEAYRILVSAWHPDRFQPGTRQHQVATEKLKEINAAYEVLRDPNKRAEYDQSLERQRRREDAQKPVAPRFTAEQERIIEQNRERYKRALSSAAIRKFCEAVNLQEARTKATADLKEYRANLAQEVMSRFLAAARR